MSWAQLCFLKGWAGGLKEPYLGQERGGAADAGGPLRLTPEPTSPGSWLGLSALGSC